jgi:hypothetical protein
MIKARNMILAALPLPTEVPDDSLQPIVIPSPYTLHEFLGNASGVSFFSSMILEHSHRLPA